MSDFKSIPVRFTVFREEYPVLYDYMLLLPKSRNRKRNALLQTMNAGADTLLRRLPSKIQAPTDGVAHIQYVAAAPVGGNAIDQTFQEVIDLDDLLIVFGEIGACGPIAL
jgi:hypothetical protein